MPGHRLTGSEDDLVGSASAKTRPVLPVARLRRKRDGGLGVGSRVLERCSGVPVKWQSWTGPSKHYAFCSGIISHPSSKIPYIKYAHVPAAITVSAADLDPGLFRRFVWLFDARSNSNKKCRSRLHRTPSKLLGHDPLEAGSRCTSCWLVLLWVAARVLPLRRLLLQRPNPEP